MLNKGQRMTAAVRTQERTIAVDIGPENAGLYVLDFVTGRFTYRSRQEWQQELEADRFILKNSDQPVRPWTRLAAGDRLVYLMPEVPEPAVDRSLVVLYEDDDLLVVDKPGGLPCHPAGRYFRNTLWTLIREEYGVAAPHFINRLDRETSGVVLVVKNKAVAQDCYRQFSERQVEKIYQVVVEGDFKDQEKLAAGFLTADQASVVRKKLRFYPAGQNGPFAGKDCSTHFRLVAGDRKLSLLEARPLTGRCHQIRATLCSLGYPVVGDKLYGVDEQFFLRFLEDGLTAADRKLLRLDRQALHAASLRIVHPRSNRKMFFSAPLPACFQDFFTDFSQRSGGL